MKEHVYLPDWLDEERLRYTNRLASILSELPADTDVDRCVSTVPGAFKPRVRSAGDIREMARRILRHAAFLRDLERQTGETVCLALEPEPRCHLETVAETVGFFRDHLFHADLLAVVSEMLPMPLTAPDVARYVGVCYDACHMAVEYEEPGRAIETLHAAGIRICKFQISSALRLDFREGDGQAEAKLGRFAEPTYLHQVVERNERGLTRYTDLPDGLSAERAARQTCVMGRDKEWRVHFHVPIFMKEIGGFETTQSHLVQLLGLLKSRTVPTCLEVETYTWDVLPAEHRTVDTATAIARELAWVRHLIET